MKDAYKTAFKLQYFQAELPEIIKRLEQEIKLAEIAEESSPPGKIRYSMPGHEMPPLREVLCGNQQLVPLPEPKAPKIPVPITLIEMGVVSKDVALAQLGVKDSNLSTEYDIYKKNLRAFKGTCEELAAYYVENPELKDTPFSFDEFLDQACRMSDYHVFQLTALEMSLNEGMKNFASERHRNSAKQMMESAGTRGELIKSMYQKIIDHCEVSEPVLREQMIHAFLNPPLPPAEERKKTARNWALGSTFTAVGIAGVTYKTSHRPVDAIPGSIFTVFAMAVGVLAYRGWHRAKAEISAQEHNHEI